MVVVTASAGLQPYAERELVARFRAASPEQRDRGRRWYPEARRRMVALAEETGYTLEQAVAVLAITSPGAQLVQNLHWTERALRTRGAEPVGRFPAAMAPKVRAVLDSPERAAEYVRGPKVGPFHRAILGDEEELVLDRWAIYAAGWTDRNELPPAAIRRMIDRAYRAAVRRTRASLRDFQATVWIQTRESTPQERRGRWFVPRLADIV